jgi:hypothetical protein
MNIMDTFILLKSVDLSSKNITYFDSNIYFNKKYDNTNTNKEYNDDIYEISLGKNKLKEIKIYNFTELKRIYLYKNPDLEKITIENCLNLDVLDVSNCPKLKEINGLEEHNIKLLVCEGETYIDFLEEKFDINVMISKDNELINHIIDNIYLGDCSHNEEELVKLGISYVFNVTNNYYREYKKMIEIKIPLQDCITQNIMDIFPTVIEQIKELNDEGLKIYIHCHAGISRSASLVIYYLIKYHNMSFDKAFKYVRDKRLCIQPNQSFVEQLKFLEKNII